MGGDRSARHLWALRGAGGLGASCSVAMGWARRAPLGLLGLVASGHCVTLPPAGLPVRGYGSYRPVPLGPRFLCPFLFWLDQPPRDQHTPRHHHHSAPDGCFNYQARLRTEVWLSLPPFPSAKPFMSLAAVCAHVFSSVLASLRVFIECQGPLLRSRGCVSWRHSCFSGGLSAPLSVPKLLPLHVSLGVSGSVCP